MAGPVGKATNADSHTQSSMQAAARLLSRQFLLGVITKESLGDLNQLSLLILSNVNMMDQEECEAIRQWVHAGGALLATGSTSLIDKQGTQQADFMLGDVLGVSLVKADWSHHHHYIAPTSAGIGLFPDFDVDHPAFCDGQGFEVRARPGATILATTTEPWPRTDNSRFSSIHSDPPWQATQNPEVVFHRFGEGSVIYCNSLIELLPALDPTFLRLVQKLQPQRQLEATAPSCVEATMFWQPKRRRYLLNLVNFQDDLPNLPVDGIEICVRSPRSIGSLKRLPEGTIIPHEVRGDQIVFRPPELETLQMFALEVKS